MARIRSIKPEFWTSEQVMELSMTARLLFIGLWNFCDDGGNHPASEKTVKAEVFPADDITSSDIRRLLVELIEQGLVMEYEVDGKLYWHVTGWHHQKIDKPNYKYPSPEKGRPANPIQKPTPLVLDDESSNGSRTVADHSPPEGIGKERIGERKEAADAADPDPVFGLGLGLLKAKGSSESAARTYLGMLVKDHGKEQVVKAIELAAEADAVEPKAFIKKVLGGAKKPDDGRPPNLPPGKKWDPIIGVYE